MNNCIVPAYLISPHDSANRGNPGDPYLDSDLYPVYAGIVAARAPETYLEIGVRYGYSFGVALDAAPSIRRAYGFDLYGGGGWGGEADAYRIGSAKLTALAYKRAVSVAFCNVNTQLLTSLSLHEDERIDLAYVDGDHTVTGCLHDMALVLPWLSDNGAMVVDDVDHHAELRQPVEDFAAAAGLTTEYYADTAKRGRLVLAK